MFRDPGTRCTRCLMPATFPGIDFDAKGVCKLCRDYQKRELLGVDVLRARIRSRQGRQYDCIVGISGGKDSCYVAYLARRKFDLKVLAVCYDFPFLCDLARTNMRSVCDSLGIELMVVKTKRNLEYNLLRNHLLSVGATGTSWGQCLFCHYGINAILYNVGIRRDIPWILGGVTKYEKWECESRSSLLLRRVRRSSVADKLRFGYYQAKSFAWLAEQRRQYPLPNAKWFDVYGETTLPGEGPQGLNVFDYVQWDQNVIEETLVKETGWVKPDKSISWRYDCSLEPFLDYTYKKEFGISTVGLYLSHQVRDGLIDRESSLKLILEFEIEENLRERLDEVFDFLMIPESLRVQFFSAA